MDIWKPLLSPVKVRRLQERLACLGFDPGEPDGRYGILTREAVRELQAAYRLSVDGIAGPEVARLLSQDLPNLRMAVCAGEGDSLSSIARTRGTTVEAIIEANARKRFERVYTGERLAIHRRAAIAIAGSRASTPTVRAAWENNRWTEIARPCFRLAPDGSVVQMNQGRASLAILTDTLDQYGTVQDPTCTGTFLHDRNRAHREQQVEKVVRGAVSARYAGVLVDLARVCENDWWALVRFLRELARECSGAGLKLGVCVPAFTKQTRSTPEVLGYDFEAIGQIADFVVADHRNPFTFWDATVSMCRVVPRWKLIACIRVCPYSTGNGSPEDLDSEALSKLRVRHVVREGRDEVSSVPYYFYRSKGVRRRVWHEDSISVGSKLHMVNRLNILGVAFRGVDTARHDVFAEIAHRFIIM
ncbi:MAG: peptidoglycan-binding protein [Firmicutes bacterium]|jgi:peptidoglycan hydrolase-like protein with peptidoglycan-binding domain|nr:peptidoglycan-binding protein [Bacillota bacterium]